MSTEYTHLVVIAVPVALIEDANHLACLMGESGADINTFSYVNYQDSVGDQYAVSATSVKPVFLLPTSTGSLPAKPDHAVSVANLVKAKRAFESLNRPGGIRMLVNVSVEDAFQQLGLTRIPSTEEA